MWRVIFFDNGYLCGPRPLILANTCMSAECRLQSAGITSRGVADDEGGRVLARHHAMADDESSASLRQPPPASDRLPCRRASDAAERRRRQDGLGGHRRRLLPRPVPPVLARRAGSAAHRAGPARRRADVAQKSLNSHFVLLRAMYATGGPPVSCVIYSIRQRHQGAVALTIGSVPRRTVYELRQFD